MQIFIAENIPSLNKGEMSIFEGMVETFKLLGGIEISMLSMVPEVDTPRYTGKARIVDLRRSLHLPAELKGLARVIGSVP